MEIQEEQLVQEEGVQDEFHERLVRASFQNGTAFREVQALFYKDTGLGYTRTQSGKFGTILESGVALCPYVLPTSWQMEEACRRIAPHVNVHAPNVYEVYQREHSGEKLGTFIKKVFFDVLDLAVLPREVLPSLEEQVESLKDFVLERAGANLESEPPFAL